MDGDSPRHYEPFLVRAAARGLPMICANPDLEVIHHGKRQVCAGRLAERYEELDGEVRWHGKPHRAVYELCFEMLKTADRRRVLAVGDSFRTDVAGAVACGIDALFVSHGIHGEELAVQPGGLPDPALLRALMGRTGLKPTVMAPSFVW
jgi:HAD superfamily hydrolase (TIGR01459 family)